MHALKSIHIDLRALKAAACIAPRNDIRYYLNSVMIEAAPDHTLYVATDGHCLLALRTEGENEVEAARTFILPLDSVEMATRGPRKALALERRMSFDETHVHLPTASGGAEIRFQPIDAQYVDWRKVFPRTTSGEASSFDPRLLRKVQDAAKDVGAGVIEIRQNGDGVGLVYFPMADRIRMTGLVMPRRANPPMFAPDWLGLEQEQQS